MQPLISIIIPVYNAQNHIHQCINSLQQQTYPNIQIVIVEDGSTDHSLLICQSYAKNDTRIKLIHQENQGEGAARNKGLDEADGSYLCFVDADDFVEYDFVEYLFQMYVKDNINLAVCGYKEQCTSKTLSETTGEKIQLSQEEAMYYLLKEEYYRGYVWNKMFDLTIIRENKIRFDVSLPLWTDVVFVFEYLTHCKLISYDPVAKYHYIFLEHSISHGKNHVIDVEKSYSTIRAQACIEDKMPLEYEKVYTQLQLRQVQSSLAVIRNIGYQKKDNKIIYGQCLQIIRNKGRQLRPYLSRKENYLVVLCISFPQLLLWMYGVKGKRI